MSIALDLEKIAPLVLWLVGEPGVGKTTAARALLPHPMAPLDGPLKITIAGTGSMPWYAAGHYTGQAFDGADSVPISGIKPLLAWWATAQPGRMLFDGDKFSTKAALDLVRAAGARVRCAHLVASTTIVQARRAQRASGGKLQNLAWVRGRATKAARFADLFAPGEVITLDTGKLGASDVGAVLRAVVAA